MLEDISSGNEFGIDGMGDEITDFLDEQGKIERENLEERTETVPAKSKQAPKTVCKAAKLVGNKRKMLEGMVKVLQEIMQQSNNKTMMKISESIASVVKSIGNGFVSLASAFANKPSNNLQKDYPGNTYPTYQNMSVQKPSNFNYRRTDFNGKYFE